MIQAVLVCMSAISTICAMLPPIPDISVPDQTSMNISCSYPLAALPYGYGWRREACSTLGTNFASIDFKNNSVVHDNLTDDTWGDPHIAITYLDGVASLTLSIPVSANTSGVYQCYFLTANYERTGSKVAVTVQIQIRLKFASDLLQVLCTVPNGVIPGDMLMLGNEGTWKRSTMNGTNSTYFWNIDYPEETDRRRCMFEMPTCPMYALYSQDLITGDYDIGSHQLAGKTYEGEIYDRVTCAMDVAGDGQPKMYWSVARPEGWKKGLDYDIMDTPRGRVYRTVLEPGFLYNDLNLDSWYLETAYTLSVRGGLRCASTWARVWFPATTMICGFVWGNTVYAKIIKAIVNESLHEGLHITQRGKSYDPGKYIPSPVKNFPD